MASPRQAISDRVGGRIGSRTPVALGEYRNTEDLACGPLEAGSCCELDHRYSYSVLEGFHSDSVARTKVYT